jgi:hypothetical protein
MFLNPKFQRFINHILGPLRVQFGTSPRNPSNVSRSAHVGHLTAPKPRAPQVTRPHSGRLLRQALWLLSSEPAKTSLLDSSLPGYLYILT